MRILLLSFAMFVVGIVNAQYNCDSFKGRSNILVNNRSVSVETQFMEEYDVKYMKLDLNAHNISTYLYGSVVFLAEVESSSLDTFVFELNNHAIDSILFEGQSLNYERSGDFVFVGLPSVISNGEIFEITVYYRGFSAGDGMSMTSIYNSQVAWTLSESFHAKDWLPVKQDLKDKIDSVDISVSVPEGIMVGSNGILSSVDTLIEDRLKYNWKSRYPIEYYLISLAIGNYFEYNIYAHPIGVEDSLLIQNFIYNNSSYISASLSDIDETIGLIELFSEKISPYPFMKEKYGHCTAPLGGGMEHQTMTTLSHFNFDLVAHELGHMWFGDNVTCATWQDIWINEGFATYTEYIAKEYLQSQSNAQDWLSNKHSSAMSTPYGSIFIPIEDASNESRIFSHQLSYDKGASIIHMIRFEMQNDDLFFETLNQFQNQFKDSVATGDDFKNLASVVSGIDFTQFFDQWYYGEGYPTYDISYYFSNDTLHFTSEQVVSSVTPLFQMLMEYKVNYMGGDTIIKVYHDTNIENYSIYLPYEITGVEVDPNDWVLDGEGTVSLNTMDRPKATFEVEIYPNPATTSINIILEDDNFRSVDYELFDLSGKIIKKFSSSKLESQMSVIGLKNGIYFLNIRTDEHSVVRRIIKNY